jgi:hypothetical protein
MAVVDLMDAIRSTGDIDKKFEHAVVTLSTATTANLNATMVLIDTLSAVPGFDKASLKAQLEALGNEPPVSNDIHGPLYSQIMSLISARLD